jgi:hypothetical protein
MSMGETITHIFFGGLAACLIGGAMAVLVMALLGRHMVGMVMLIKFRPNLLFYMLEWDNMVRGASRWSLVWYP